MGNNCLIKNIEIDVTNSTAIQFLNEVNIYHLNNLLLINYYLLFVFNQKFRKVNHYLGISSAIVYNVVH